MFTYFFVTPSQQKATAAVPLLVLDRDARPRRVPVAVPTADRAGDRPSSAAAAAADAALDTDDMDVGRTL